MPFPNEHSCRLVSPTKFDRFRRNNNAQKINGKFVDVIFGIKANKSEIQALRFPLKNGWKASQARAVCKRRKGILFEPATKKNAEGMLVDEKVEETIDGEIMEAIEYEDDAIQFDDEGCGCDPVETAETTNSPPWGDIKKNKENFPNKSQFIVQRGEKREGWKLPYKLKNGKIHCGGVRAASAAAAGARTGKPMSLTSAERRRLNSARRACKIEDSSDGISQEMNLTLSTGKAGKFECLDDRSDDAKRVMRFELMDNAELYNGVRFTKEALQHQLDIFNEGEFLVTHGMDHSGRIRDQLGKVIEMELVEDGDIATIFITSEHYKETPAQIDAETLFNQGLLDSISGGWRARIAYNSDTEEYEVYKPKLREVSSTPIPAKTSAKTIENVCMDISVGLLLNQAPDMEELDMTEGQEPQEPSEEGKEVQSVKDSALEARTATVEQQVAEMTAKHVAQERAGLLKRAAELELSEDLFEGKTNEQIEFALEVANKVKMSTLRGSDPDIPLGGDGNAIEDDGPEMKEYLSEHIYRSDIMRD